MKKRGFPVVLALLLFIASFPLAAPVRAADTGKTYTLKSMNTLNENGNFRSNGWTEPQYHAGETVTLTAIYDNTKAKFQGWEIPDGVTLIEGNKNTEKITFIMPDRDITMNAVSEYIVPLYDIIRTTNVSNSRLVGRLTEGDTMRLKPNDVEGPYKFQQWEIPDGVTLLEGDKNTEMIRIVMPDHDVTLKALFTRFDDVLPGAYSFDPVLWAVKQEITNGTSDTTFSPNNTCTTAQILTFLWRANGSPAPAIANPFSDVPNSVYYEKAAVWAYEQGLISGLTFNGGSPCTRAATMKYLWILAGRPSLSAANPFADVPNSADYARAVLWAVQNGVTNGTSATTFAPNNTCTRGQIVTFLYRHYA